jgi:large subunit ribosomal protein L30
MAEQENNQQQEGGGGGAGGGTIRIQYYRSFIAAPKTHKQIVRSIGLTKLNQTVERPDTPAMRGFVAKVPHLLRIIE